MKFNGDYQKILCELNETNFFAVMEKYSLQQSELLGIIDCSLSSSSIKIKRKKYEKILKQYQYIQSFKDRKYLILSDTHLGSLFQNFSNIQKAYDFSVCQGVEIAFHLGDFFEGCNGKTYDIRPPKLIKIYKNCLSQIDWLKNYPTIIPTYILLGNHDRSFLDIGIDLTQEFQKRNDCFRILGYGGVYVNCHYRKIYMEHFIRNMPYLKNNYGYDFFFRGHSHFFQYYADKKMFYVPSLSDLQQNKNGNGMLLPGFVILTIHNRSMDLDGYTFVDGEVQPCLKLKL